MARVQVHYYDRNGGHLTEVEGEGDSLLQAIEGVVRDLSDEYGILEPGERLEFVIIEN